MCNTKVKVVLYKVQMEVHVFLSTVLAKLLHCAPAWAGFCIAGGHRMNGRIPA